MKATRNNAIKIFESIVKGIEEKQKEALQEFWTKEDRLINIIPKEIAKGRYKEIYEDNDVLLIMELTHSSDEAYGFFDTYFYPAIQANPKKYESFDIQFEDSSTYVVYPA